MKRTIEDIRENLDHVGCDNETALEMCDEIERLRRDAYPIFDILPRLFRAGHRIDEQDGRWWLFDAQGEGVISGETYRSLCINIIFMEL